jgi:plastocyanin
MQRYRCASILESSTPGRLARICALVVMGFALTNFTVPKATGENRSNQQVTIDNFSFSPATLTVPAGTEVTWVNHDDIPHTVVSDDKTTFKSRALDTDEKFSFTFAKPGTYTYFCSLHPHMTAKVVVQ